MALLEYISDTERRASLAEACDTIGDYLWQVATGRRKASHTLAIKIENATDGAVTRHQLRPDIYGPAPAGKQRKARTAA